MFSERYVSNDLGSIFFCSQFTRARRDGYKKYKKKKLLWSVLSTSPISKFAFLATLNRIRVIEAIFNNGWLVEVVTFFLLPARWIQRGKLCHDGKVGLFCSWKQAKLCLFLLSSSLRPNRINPGLNLQIRSISLRTHSTHCLKVIRTRVVWLDANCGEFPSFSNMLSCEEGWKPGWYPILYLLLEFSLLFSALSWTSRRGKWVRQTKKASKTSSSSNWEGVNEQMKGVSRVSSPKMTWWSSPLHRGPVTRPLASAG